MADEDKAAGLLGRIVAFAKNWQVMVAVVAAVTGVWFNLTNEERKRSELNREAIRMAEQRGDAAFAADPYYTVVFFEAAYPRHAYCAALTALVARADRLSGAGPARGDGARAMADVRDAIGNEIEQLAHEVGLTADALQRGGERLGRDGRACDAQLTGADLGRFWMPEECLRVLAGFQKTACLAESRRQSAVRAEAALRDAEPVTVAAARAATPPGVAAHPEAAGRDVEPASVAAAGVAAEPQAPEAPAGASSCPTSDACGDPAARPVVYMQIVDAADHASATHLREALERQGWTVPGIETVKGGRTSGDVRYYYADQCRCAELLATQAIAALDPALTAPKTPLAGGLKLISLAKTYRNLPRGRIELWLPPLGGK